MGTSYSLIYYKFSNKMRKLFVLLLQFMALHVVHSQNININDISGYHRYPSTADIKQNEPYIGIYYEYIDRYYLGSESMSSNLHLYGNGFYILFYNIRSLDKIAPFEIVMDWDTGRYIVDDKLLNLYLADTLAYQFNLIDTLNIKIMYAIKNNFKLNCFFRRDHAFFKDQILGDKGIFRDGCLSCRWAISKRYMENFYDCYYYNSPGDEKTIKEIILPDSIYIRLKE